MSDEHEQFTGSWWNYPPLRNALLAGVIALSGFLLGYISIFTHELVTWFYWIAIVLGGYFRAKEGLEKLVEKHEIGISILMLAATAGAGALDLWDEDADQTANASRDQNRQDDK